MGEYPRLCTFLALLFCVGSRECPVSSPSAMSGSSEAEVSFRLANMINDKLELVWINTKGDEKYVRDVQAGEEIRESTYSGHVFRAYSKSAPRQLVMEHKVMGKGHSAMMSILPCGDLALFPKWPRAKEFEELAYMRDDSKCDGDNSALWSCVRYLDAEELSQRDSQLYGLGDGENEEGQPEHSFVDGTYTRQIKNIPKVTSKGPGYLRMRFTPRLMEALNWWKKYSAKHGGGRREFVAGGYTNAKTHEQNIESLDNHRDIHGIITSEMQQILEWWTGMQLTHTATFGVRTYHRGSVLIDHVDRHDTHVASAVLQMSQTVDVGGGWPLEVMLPNDAVGEVYLQPGEMVLYEGAWLRHGRPMKFRGTNFSNVFAHFRPKDWEETRGAQAKEYYGVPEERFTTIADHGFQRSDQYGFLSKRSNHLQEM